MMYPWQRQATSPSFHARPRALVLALHLAMVGVAAQALLPINTVYAAEVPAASKKQYAIKAGPLGNVLAEFSAVSGVKLSFDPNLLAGQNSPGLQGTYSVDGGFDKLLAGSGFELEDLGDSAYSLRKAQAAAVKPKAVATAEEEVTLPQVAVTATETSETAWGPVKGYVAKRSGTATKIDSEVIETPQSIAIVTAEQIEDTKATSLAEAMAYTPGIMHDWGYSNSYDVFYSRGYRLQDGNGGVYRDGLKLGASGWASGQQEPYGMERVELLKGAASVLFGAAAPGGILNVITKQPHPDMVNEVRVEAGNYEHKALALDVGNTWSDQVSGRVVFLARNAETEVDHIPNDTVYIAPSLRFAPSEDTSLTLLAHFNKRRTAYIYGVPVEGSLISSPNGRIPRDRFIGEPGYDRQDTNQHSLGYLFSHDFSDALSLKHGVRYLDSRNHIHFTGIDGTNAGDSRLIDRTAYDELESTRGISVDTNLTYRFETGELKHTVTGGVDFSRYTIGSRWKVATLAPLNVFDPVYGSEPGTFALAFDSEEKQRRIGVYVQDQIKFGGLTVLFGGREDRANSAPVGGEEEDTSAFSSRFGLVYEFDNGFAPFVSFSESFEPQSGTDNNGKRYKPTEGEQIELGLRWQNADGSFLASGAVYRLLQTNVKSRRIGLPQPVQTGEVLSEGVEFEAKGKLTHNLSVIASYSYTDAVTRKSEVASQVGLPQPGVPQNQAALWAKFENVWLPGLEFGLGARYVGTTEDWNGTRTSVPSFVTFDTLLGYTTGPWSVDLNINNLTNKDTMLCSYATCVYGDGRRATASVGYHW
ncbi:MAG: TonB-dependent siderophore receptor [Methylophilaceae bacterium]